MNRMLTSRVQPEIIPVTARVKDLTGLTFGRLTVLGRTRGAVRRDTWWACKCACGNFTVSNSDRLQNKSKSSCGCFCLENQQLSRKPWKATHGQSGTPEYLAWLGMVKRCYDEEVPGYHNYGGRGITVSPEWRGSFEAFFADMGQRPGPGYSIDRIDNSRGYEAGNCRWTTHKTQCRNTRVNRMIEFKGEKKCVAEWAEVYGVEYDLLYRRLHDGWDFEKAVTKKSRQARSRTLQTARATETDNED